MNRSLLALLVFATGMVALLAASTPTTNPPVPPAIATVTVEIPNLQPRGYVCYRARQPITIDGHIQEQEWKDAPWSEPFVDIEGERRPRPTYRTRVKMLWDDECLYIAAQLEEPHVWATLKEHDSVIFHDNDFEVFLDPDGDNHLYAELELNALNTTWDLLLTKPYKDGGRAINAWEIAGLRTAVQVDGTINDPRDTDRGWTIEIAWPWKGLAELHAGKPLPRHGDQWRIDFSRVEWQHEVVGGQYRIVPGIPEANWVWSPQGVINMHRPETWGILQFSTAEPGTTAFRPDPAGAVRQALHQVYYAQQEYHKQQGSWATSLDALGLARLSSENPSLKMQSTDHAMEAIIKLRTADGRIERWCIDSESRIRKE